MRSTHEVTISGCNFINNTVRSPDSSHLGHAAGGAVYMDTVTIVDIFDNIFANNTADDSGGAFEMASYPGKGDGALSIRSCSFTNNSADSARSGSGAIGLSSINVRNRGTTYTTSISSCNFTLNDGGWAGAIAVAYLQDLAVFNCSFEQNRGQKAGAIFAQLDQISLQRVVLSSCSGSHNPSREDPLRPCTAAWNTGEISTCMAQEDLQLVGVNNRWVYLSVVPGTSAVNLTTTGHGLLSVMLCLCRSLAVCSCCLACAHGSLWLPSKLTFA